MSSEQTARALIAAFDAADVAGIVKLYAPVTEYHNPFSPAPITSREMVEAFESGMFSAFDQISATVNWLVADGDHVAYNATISARQCADLPTPDGNVIPNTGAMVVIDAVDYLRVDAEGRIVEHRRHHDPAGFLAQLGVRV